MLRFFIVNVIIIIGLTCPVQAQFIFSPLDHSNQYPLFFPFMEDVLKPLPMDSNQTAAVQWSLFYTTMNYFLKNETWSSGVDMEHSTYIIDLAFSVGRISQFRVMVPVYYQWDGFMDSFLIWYHDLLGLPNYGRENRPRNEYAFYLEHNSDTLITGKKNQFLLGNPVLGIISSVANGENWNLQAGLHVKVPIASHKTGLSSGTTDVGFAMYHALSRDRWSFYNSLAYIVIGKQEAEPWNKTKNTFTYLSALEYRIDQRWSFISQFSGNTGIYTGMGLGRQEIPSLEFVNGIRFKSDLGVLTVGLSEDLTYTAPDFTIFLNWRPIQK